jgi:putative transposase
MRYGPSSAYRISRRALPYHLSGNGRADIFLDDGDRQVFLDVLATICHRLDWLCYAYLSHYQP